MLHRTTLAAALAACSALPALAQAGPAAAPPKLLVFITVDQLLPEYFTRFEGQLQGGLARLWNGGAVFTDAHQDHGVTETAPGHASTLSGRFPRGTGIVRNLDGVQDPASPLVGSDTALGASPHRFRGTALFDWLQARDPRSRALSVSPKDRSAILPLGRARQSVFWYAYQGRFVTSRWYADTLPDWVERFNARGAVGRHRGRAWTLLLPESAYPEPDSVRVESRGTDQAFPHPAPADSAGAARRLPDFPWMDQVTLELALAGLSEMGLGAGEATDVLAVSLSATDAVGHRYGPDSREIHDQVLRLDRALGVFLDSLFRLRDSRGVVVALTADHGVAPFPEVRHGRAGADSLSVRPATFRGWLYAELRALGLDTAAVEFDDGMV
ncbi:MAG TPA: alkaline phosphatase family protein, partial [Longimicrobiaceae bacterium]|nr:alkaline phosphatase family protein [Longimicrobiaceae bacterium]